VNHFRFGTAFIHHNIIDCLLSSYLSYYITSTVYSRTQIQGKAKQNKTSGQEQAIVYKMSSIRARSNKKQTSAAGQAFTLAVSAIILSGRCHVEGFVLLAPQAGVARGGSALKDASANQYEGWNGQRVMSSNNDMNIGLGIGMEQQRDYEYGMVQQPQGQQSQQERDLRASVRSSSPDDIQTTSISRTVGGMVPYQDDPRDPASANSMQPFPHPNNRGMSTSPIVRPSALDLQGPNQFDRYQNSNPSYDGHSDRLIQGNTRKTFQNDPYYNNPHGTTQQEVFMQTAGGPMQAEVELWDGPNNTPTSVKVFSEDGNLRPFMATIETRNPFNPNHSPETSTSIRNTGPMEFPLAAGIAPVARGAVQDREPRSKPLTIDGGALKTWTFDHSVQAVQIKLTTDGLPLMALVELWGCGGHTKQIAEIYNDDGQRRPFYATIQTPGYAGDTIAVRNKGFMEYPITVQVEPLY
jgi:hypothetical protein